MCQKCERVYFCLLTGATSSKKSFSHAIIRPRRSGKVYLLTLTDRPSYLEPDGRVPLALVSNAYAFLALSNNQFWFVDVHRAFINGIARRRTDRVRHNNTNLLYYIYTQCSSILHYNAICNAWQYEKFLQYFSWIIVSNKSVELFLLEK